MIESSSSPNCMESASRRISLSAVLTSSTGICGLIDGKFGCLLTEMGATPNSSSCDIAVAVEDEAATPSKDGETRGDSLGGLRIRISSMGIFSGIP